MVRAIKILKERQSKDPYKDIGTQASAPPDHLIRTEALNNMNQQIYSYPSDLDYSRILPKNSADVFKLSEGPREDKWN